MILFGKQKAYDAYFKILENEKDSGALSEIISAAAKYNFGGKLWQTFIAWLIINDENPYSLACERRECSSPSLCAIAALDMKELFDAFNIRHNGILGSDFCGGKGFGGQCEYIGNLASQLASHLSAAADISEFKGCIDSFFAEYGVGLFGLNKAFHIENHAQLTLKPADSFDPVRFSDLWGYEIQKKELIDNTAVFERQIGKQRAALRRQRYGQIHCNKGTFERIFRPRFENYRGVQTSIRAFAGTL